MSREFLGISIGLTDESDLSDKKARFKTLRMSGRGRIGRRRLRSRKVLSEKGKQTLLLGKLLDNL